MSNFIKNYIPIIFFLVIGAFFYSYAVSRDVEISAGVYSCVVGITVKPEKRIPPINNWSNFNSIEIRNQLNVPVTNLNLNMNNLGFASFNLCSEDIFIPEGVYNFYVRGFSHLRKLYPNIDTFNFQSVNIDLSGTNNFLVAGETSNIFDNYINALDISTQVSNIYSNDLKNDLNRDGLVNAMDISITITNYYKFGD